MTSQEYVMNNKRTLLSHGNLFNYIRTPNWFSRSAALAATAAMLNLYVAPSIAAVQGMDEAQKKREAIEEAKLGDTTEERFSNTLEQLQKTTRSKHIRITERLKEEGGLLDDILTFFGLSQLTLEEKSDLQGLEGRITKYHADMLKSLQDQTQWMEDKKLPEKILQRQRAKLADYENQYQTLLNRLNAFYAAEDLTTQGAEAEQLNEFMQQHQIKQSNQPFDPNNLPWGSPDPEKTPKPANTVEELLSSSGVSPYPQGIEVASNNAIPPLGDINGPTASDLGENIEVQLTDEIRAKAAELDHDPVKIYNWVRNNTEWLPTFGSIQGSQYTMDTMKGNAFDIASLLIALLRASNIPARYAYGSVDIPTDKMNNWVGGTKNVDATQSLMGQGGIPNQGMVLGGVVQFVRMNHIWVEAWVDYFPSSGAEHQVGDSWIPMDASYKQYEYKEGKDLQTEVPFDAENFAQQLIDSATIDEQAGTVEGIDQNLIETQLTDYQQQIQTYIDGLDPTTTVGDVLGEQKVIKQERMTLASGLPYQLHARTNNFHSLPDNLRYFYNLVIKKGGGNSKLAVLSPPREVGRGRFPLAEIANSFLALSFEPETEDDKQALSLLIPEPAEGEDIQPEDMPTSLPGGVIGMKAQITVNGEIKKEISNWLLGEEFTFSQYFEKPQNNYSHPQDTIGVAGAYYAVGLGFGEPNRKKIERLQKTLEEANSELDLYRKNKTLVPTMTIDKHKIAGNFMQAGVHSWFAKTSLEAKELAFHTNTIFHNLPSFGTFSPSLVVNFTFGVIARGVSIAGLQMDIQGLRTARVNIENDLDKAINFQRIRGALASANEHQVPEMLFAGDDAVVSISAVKALQVAAEQGQKIYSINIDNVDQLNRVTAGDRNEMHSAVLAGKRVIVHEKPIQGFGKITSGYIILDPESGAGAYLISGGGNGGVILLFIASLLMLILVAVTTAGPLIAFAAFNVAILGLGKSIDLMPGGKGAFFASKIIVGMILTFYASIMVGALAISANAVALVDALIGGAISIVLSLF